MSGADRLGLRGRGRWVAASGWLVVAGLTLWLAGAQGSRSGAAQGQGGGSSRLFNGLGMDLGNLSRLSDAKTRSISAENPTGAKGQGGMATEGTGKGASRDLGRGWKVSPSIVVPPRSTHTLADVEGPGAIQSMWITGFAGRDMILRIYWDGQGKPSVEAPLADFFGLPWVPNDQAAGTRGALMRVNSVPISVNPNKGLNCFWTMPFRKHARVTLENRSPGEAHTIYFQINYTLTDVPNDQAYFHAQFRRVNPLPYKDVYTIVDGIKGKGQYVGTVLGLGVTNNRWWGEGEIKFYLDGDSEFPTINGTGTEDYFGGAYDWEVNGQYSEYTTPFLGMHQVVKPDGLYSAVHRHAMYRFHVMDPIRFDSDLKVTIQALGWRGDGRYLPEQPDICSVAFWYQTLPTAAFPPLPDRDALEIN